MIRTERRECAATASATLPISTPANPVRPWEPSTIRPASCSSATSTMPFQVGADSTAAARALNPACSGQRGSLGGGLLGGLLDLGDLRRVELRLARRARIRRRTGARRVRTSASRPGRAGGRPRRSRASRARSRRRRTRPGRAARCRGRVGHALARAPRRARVASSRSRTAARSGGEYHAGPSPSMKRVEVRRLRARTAERVEQRPRRQRRRSRARGRSRARSRCPAAGHRRRWRRSARTPARS